MMWPNCSVHKPWHSSAAKTTLRLSCLETSGPVHVWPHTISFWLIIEPRRPSRLQFPLPRFPKGQGNGKFQQLVSMVTRRRTSVRGTNVQPWPQERNCEKVERQRNEGWTDSFLQPSVSVVCGAPPCDWSVCHRFTSQTSEQWVYSAPQRWTFHSINFTDLRKNLILYIQEFNKKTS